MDRIPSIALLVVATVTIGLGQGAGRGPAVVQPPLGSTPKPAIPNAKPVRSCESLAMVALPNTTIESAKIDANNSNVCRVTAITTHPPAGDKVRIWVAIPMSSWNGRFIGTGGGGFVGGSEAGVNQPLALGYAGGATDTGHVGGSGSFAMDANGHLDWQLVRDNAHVGIHEMTVTGKALTQALYNAAPKYSYFNGCSTGGRQGLMEAQRYPDDYNGIVSAAPAINWPKLMMQSIWSTAVMNAARNPVPACKLQAATAAAIEACDAIDGVKDGVIEDPTRCTFDPKTLIGKPAGTCGAFTEADADVIRKLLEGPRRADGTLIWHGQPWGADMTALAATRGNPLQPQAFTFATDWIRYWLLQNPQFDANSLTPDLFEHFWDQSLEQYGIVIGTDNPDLAAFRDHGGKLVLWHGWADQLITTQGQSTTTSVSCSRWAVPKRPHSSYASSWLRASDTAGAVLERCLRVSWTPWSRGSKAAKLRPRFPHRSKLAPAFCASIRSCRSIRARAAQTTRRILCAALGFRNRTNRSFGIATPRGQAYARSRAPIP